MKKLVALGMALTMVMSILTGCGGSASSGAASSGVASSDAASGSSASSDFNVPAGAKVVKFGNSGAIGEPAPETCQYFCDQVNAKIGDRYYFEFYPAEQLGNETTMLENIQVGLQEGVMTSLDTLASYESDLNILSISKQLGVSCAPVREALNMLNKDGLVDLTPYKTASVAVGTEEDYKTAFDLRLILEPYALRQSIDLISDEEIAAM